MIRLGVSVDGAALRWWVGGSAIALRAQVAYDVAAVGALAAEIVQLLARATRDRKLAGRLRHELVRAGEALYRALVPREVEGALGDARKVPLTLELDEALLGIPWELVFDGREHWCRRFDLGRVVATAQAVRAPVRGLGGQTLAMLAVMADDGTLDAVAAEGDAILRAAQGRPGVTLRVRHEADTGAVASALKDYDVVHFAGHGRFDPAEPARSGWQVGEGAFTAGDVAALAGGRPMPALVFSNACQSSREVAWTGGGVYGLASAFLLAGVRAYVGTQWDVVDGHSEVFAGAFYRSLLDGRTLGAAVRKGREAVIAANGEDALAWAAYVVYGDPAQVLWLPRASAGPQVPTPDDLARRASLKAAPPRRRVTLQAMRAHAQRQSPFALAAWVLAAAVLTGAVVVGLLRLLG